MPIASCHCDHRGRLPPYQLCNFRNGHAGAHDDDVDSTTQALNYMRGSNLTYGLLDFFKRIAENESNPAKQLQAVTVAITPKPKTDEPQVDEETPRCSHCSSTMLQRLAVSGAARTVAFSSELLRLCRRISPDRRCPSTNSKVSTLLHGKLDPNVSAAPASPRRVRHTCLTRGSLAQIKRISTLSLIIRSHLSCHRVAPSHLPCRLGRKVHSSSRTLFFGLLSS